MRFIVSKHQNYGEELPIELNNLQEEFVKVPEEEEIVQEDVQEEVQEEKVQVQEENVQEEVQSLPLNVAQMIPIEKPKKRDVVKPKINEDASNLIVPLKQEKETQFIPPRKILIPKQVQVQEKVQVQQNTHVNEEGRQALRKTYLSLAIFNQGYKRPDESVATTDSDNSFNYVVVGLAELALGKFFL